MGSNNFFLAHCRKVVIQNFIVKTMIEKVFQQFCKEEVACFFHLDIQPQRHRKQSKARGGGGGQHPEKGHLYYFSKQAEKPKFKKIACLY